jgi:tRNA-Thr(GGU) m(6)t(6)A37 methyltransferase TsaA
MPISVLLTFSILSISTLVLLQWQRIRSRGIFHDGGNDDSDVLLPSKDDGDDKIRSNNKHHRPTLEDEMLLAAGAADGSSMMSLTIQPIGVVRSVYRLCVGTPRQGLLAPHARGRVDLTNNDNMTMNKDAVLGLQEYSHIWIIFIFHLNTLPKEQNRSENNNNNKRRAFPLKISPPALGGSRKVGVLSTRSPHRPNPIGMTLARLDRIETKKTTTSLYISGLDLVDGTPVIDIKPYVPHYDSPYPLSLLPPLSDNNTYCRLPPWVADGLATKRRVVFLPQALSDLQLILEPNNPKNNNALEFYGIGKCGDQTTIEVMDSIKSCIQEVFTIDVRSRWQSNKVRSGKFQAQRAHRVQLTFATAVSMTTGAAAADDSDTDNNNIDREMETTTCCTQQLDRLLIHYKVSSPDEMNRPMSSTGSGAEDVVHVLSIELLQQVQEAKTVKTP